MGLFNIFKKKGEAKEKVGGMEDFMTLIRVYYQSVLAANLGITNISMLPDLATFKRTLKVATQNNKLGVAERTAPWGLQRQGLCSEFTLVKSRSLMKIHRHAGPP